MRNHLSKCPSVAWVFILSILLLQAAAAQSPPKVAVCTVSLTVQDDLKRESEAWNLIRDSQEEIDFRHFVSNYPKGTHLQAALTKLRELEGKRTAGKPPQVVEQQSDSDCDIESAGKLYGEKFLPNYKSVEQGKIASDAAKEYLAKYGKCSVVTQYVTYLTKWLAAHEYVDSQSSLIEDFNAAVKNDNAENVFAFGEQMIGKRKYPLVAMLFIVESGYRHGVCNRELVYIEKTIQYTNELIKEINDNKTPETGKWNPFDDRADALAWLNFTLGQIYFDINADAESAIPYYYQSSKFYSPILTPYYKSYSRIGDWYLRGYEKAVSDYSQIEGGVNKAETFRLPNGYADRALDAYGRAYLKAKADKQVGFEVTDKIRQTFERLYRILNSEATNGMETYLENLKSKPMPNPTTPI